MARVTEAEVLEIMDTTLESADITPFITSANVLVTEALSSAGLSADILKEIERWLAAHFVAMTKERQSKEEGAGGAYIKWAGQWGLQLEGTSYGQVAMSLDSSNTLMRLQQNKRIAIIYAIPGV